MPELPEVETVSKSIEKHLIGKSFSELCVFWPKVLHNFSNLDFKHHIRNKKIIRVYRRAKFIIIDFKSGILAAHLRMTGKLYVLSDAGEGKKHVSAFLKFSNKYLIFEDVRKFGRFYFYSNIQELSCKLGIEPLTKGFSSKWLIANLAKKNRQIKPLLLDQTFISGLGNIYTDEALWRSKVHPLSKSNYISIEKVKKLNMSIKKVLSDSIEVGGTTIRDYTYDYSYVGNYALNLKVYGRKDRPCKRCDTTIIKQFVGQRGTYICPQCQTL